MSYTIIDGLGSNARLYEGLTAAEAVEKAEAMLANGRKHVRVVGPGGPIDLDALKLAEAGVSVKSG